MTRKNINPKTQQPYKVLWFGDLVVPSGFGRIGNEVTRRLRQRGYDVQGAGISYSGWPHDLPFHVWPIGAADLFNALVSIYSAYQPDVIVSCQDFPYHHAIRHACKIDFSRVKWAWITPIDGSPVHPEWAKLADYADGKMVISRFGVEVMRQAGKRVELCHPGVDSAEFYPAEPEERADLRAKAGYGADDYIVGVMCMNQGRKAIAPMIAAFHEFARDKPNARLYLDMDKSSPAGWDIPNLLRQMAWSDDEQKRVKYREDTFKADQALFAPLRNRYALLDAHMVISHREGFGLPLLESMACRLPTLALDWCSGPEIVGDGRGILVRRIDYMENGCWGGARDAFPDMGSLTGGLQLLYERPEKAAALAAAGYEWALRQTWDVTADQVETVIQSALARDRKVQPSHEPDPTQPNPAPGLSDTHGPAIHGTNGRTPVDSVSHHPGLQPSGQSDPVPEVAGADGQSGGGGGSAAAADTG